MHQQTLLLVDDPKVTIANKVKLIAEEMKMGLATVKESINAINDPVEKINIATGIATQLVFQGKGTARKRNF